MLNICPKKGWERAREGEEGRGGRKEENQVDEVREGTPELSVSTSAVHSSPAGPPVHLPVSYKINFLVTAPVLGRSIAIT